jgi:hypothetical protein
MGRGQQERTSDERVFMSEHSPFTRDGFAKLLKAAAARAGMTKGVILGCFRIGSPPQYAAHFAVHRWHRHGVFKGIRDRQRPRPRCCRNNVIEIALLIPMMVPRSTLLPH